MGSKRRPGASNRAADVPRHRLDDVRRFVSALAAGVGLAPSRASALASHLLWFDAAGAGTLGVATLPALLERIEARSIDPNVEAKVVSERPSTAVLDGRQGVPMLVLESAGGLATEKARDTGLGLVRVRNVASPGSAAGVAAGMAIGPVAALILGPAPSWAVALPAEEGLPAVFDAGLGDPVNRANAEAAARSAFDAMVAPWAAVLAPEGGWLVAAVSVLALEPMAAFHERVSDTLNGLDESTGRLLPGPWEERRRKVREQGLAVEPTAWEALMTWAGRLGVGPPAPLP